MHKNLRWKTITILAVFVASLWLLWSFSTRLADGLPAPVYRVLRAVPAGTTTRETAPATRPAAASEPELATSWADSPLFHSVLRMAGKGPAGTLTSNPRGSTESVTGVSPA